ncbi:hypothetical protein F5146DRAFT_1002522 [Armillaria mellea]|nr:hypothetical protein F5146DRAFT_1002522 [Armillaria mellea]
MILDLQVLTLYYQELDNRTDSWKPKKLEDIVTSLFRSFNLSSLEEHAVKDLASDFRAEKDDKKVEEVFYDFLERSGFSHKKAQTGSPHQCHRFPKNFNMAFRLLDLDIWLPCPDTAALFFRAMLSTRDKTDVLPELRSLKAEYGTPIHVTDMKEVDDIADMIASRYHPPNAVVAEIQSVHITVSFFSQLSRQSFQARLKKLLNLAQTHFG